MENLEYIKIKDKCRRNLNKYTLKAFSAISRIDKPYILDAGCGTGVSSLALFEKYDCIIYAIDTDVSSLNYFQDKITTLKNNKNINIINGSILNESLFDFKFDIILAEGLLNVIGFEDGIKMLIKNLKNRGYLIIHDEYKNDQKKRDFFSKNNLNILSTFDLTEEVWLNEYFYCLKKNIEANISINQNKFELSEIENQINNSRNLKSIYYIVQYFT